MTQLERNRKWRAENRTEVNARRRARYRADETVRAAEAERGRIRRQSERYRNDEKRKQREKLRSRKHELKKYGLTPEQFCAMSASQGGVCAICKQPDKTKRGVLHVDHDHITGKNRALLCTLCNLALGGFRDDPKLLAAGIAYLQEHA